MDGTTRDEAYGVAVANVSVSTSRPEDGEHSARRAGWGLGLGIAFTGMLSHLTSSVSGEHAGEHAAALSGLFNTATRAGGVIGTAAFGTLYLSLVHHPGQAVHGFAMLNLALAATALAATSMAVISVRRR